MNRKLILLISFLFLSGSPAFACWNVTDLYSHTFPFIFPWAIFLAFYFIWEKGLFYHMKKFFPREGEVINLRDRPFNRKELVLILLWPWIMFIVFSYPVILYFGFSTGAILFLWLPFVIISGISILFVSKKANLLGKILFVTSSVLSWTFYLLFLWPGENPLFKLGLALAFLIVFAGLISFIKSIIFIFGKFQISTYSIKLRYAFMQSLITLMMIISFYMAYTHIPG